MEEEDGVGEYTTGVAAFEEAEEGANDKGISGGMSVVTVPVGLVFVAGLLFTEGAKEVAGVYQDGVAVFVAMAVVNTECGFPASLDELDGASDGAA